tara:strand:- start:722 stop:853 length:132 start_codon:yes stop_codon:yes gene_type:complete
MIHECSLTENAIRMKEKAAQLDSQKLANSLGGCVGRALQIICC